MCACWGINVICNKKEINVWFSGIHWVIRVKKHECKLLCKMLKNAVKLVVDVSLSKFAQ